MRQVKFLLTLLLVSFFAFSTTLVKAQSDNARGWGARRRLADRKSTENQTQNTTVAAAGENETLEPEGRVRGLSSRAIPSSVPLLRQPLVGAWYVEIPQSDGGLPPFNAYHTFNADGTFTEVSDLLTTQTESPAHGVWFGLRPDFLLTFELFVFDGAPPHAPVGRIRVRNKITVAADGDSFTAEAIVDFIEPNGTVIEHIDSGTFKGTRVKVLPLK